MNAAIQPGDYVSWKSRNGSKCVGRVVLIRDNELQGLRGAEDIPPDLNAQFFLVDTGEGMQVIVDLIRGLERVWIQ